MKTLSICMLLPMTLALAFFAGCADESASLDPVTGDQAAISDPSGDDPLEVPHSDGPDVVPPDLGDQPDDVPAVDVPDPAPGPDGLVSDCPAPFGCVRNRTSSFTVRATKLGNQSQTCRVWNRPGGGVYDPGNMRCGQSTNVAPGQRTGLAYDADAFTIVSYDFQVSWNGVGWASIPRNNYIRIHDNEYVICRNYTSGRPRCRVY